MVIPLLGHGLLQKAAEELAKIYTFYYLKIYFHIH